MTDEWPPLTGEELKGLEIAKAFARSERAKELIGSYSKWSEDYYCAGFLHISSPLSLLQFLRYLANPFENLVEEEDRDLYDYEQELVDMVNEWPMQPQRIEEGNKRREEEELRQKEWQEHGRKEWIKKMARGSKEQSTDVYDYLP